MKEYHSYVKKFFKRVYSTKGLNKPFEPVLTPTEFYKKYYDKEKE
jgi:hypothetical protein